MEANLTEIQKRKMSIAANLNFDVEKAKEVFDFVISDEPAAVQPIQPFWSDGVYYVLEGGYLADIDDHKSIADQVIGVAVKMRNKIATVALHDAADGEEISLTKDEGNGTPAFYHSKFFDAITDWNGEANTKDYGDSLNPEIDLKEGQYIPSLAQLHLILLNIKEVNKALEAVSGSPMREKCYWSSTEHSAGSSWLVNFSDGYSTFYKYETFVVRPAVHCQFLRILFKTIKKMKVNELRIGNLVEIDRGIGIVVGIMESPFENHCIGEGYPIIVKVNGCYYDCEPSEVQGVLITPDYLHSMGFIEEKIDNWVRYRKGKFCLVEENGANINYVHELQNVYYALYKKELEEVVCG